MSGTIIASWFCRIVAAFILLQTLFFKFTGAEESVHIFTQLGVEPWGRYLVGSFELVAGILLLIPLTAWLGAALALLLMGGAIFTHITQLGFAVQVGGESDQGMLFSLAILVTVCAATTLVLHRRDLPFGPWKHIKSDPSADPDVGQDQGSTAQA